MEILRRCAVETILYAARILLTTGLNPGGFVLIQATNFAISG